MHKKIAYYGAAFILGAALSVHGMPINTAGYWIVVACVVVMLLNVRS